MNETKNIQQRIIKSSNNNILSKKKPALLAASKGQAIDRIEQAIQSGITLFGENRIQDAQKKWPDILKRHPDLELHLIGPLQTNKVKEALELFHVIQTLDRPKLAEIIAKHLEGHHSSHRFFIQVNTGEEPQKAGILPQETDAFIVYCIKELKLPVAGLMCIPPADQPPAPHFALLRQIAYQHDLQELSMGMSDDFETAIRMGSTCVRIGRALFGERL